jgi:hypothetical protein
MPQMRSLLGACSTRHCAGRARRWKCRPGSRRSLANPALAAATNTAPRAAFFTPPVAGTAAGELSGLFKSAAKRGAAGELPIFRRRPTAACKLMTRLPERSIVGSGGRGCRVLGHLRTSAARPGHGGGGERSDRLALARQAGQDSYLGRLVNQRTLRHHAAGRAG